MKKKKKRQVGEKMEEDKKEENTYNQWGCFGNLSLYSLEKAGLKKKSEAPSSIWGSAVKRKMVSSFPCLLGEGIV